VGIPPALKTSIKESLRYVYAYGMFGQIRSLPFKFVSDSLIEVEDACNTHAPLNDKVASLKLKYLQNPDSVRETESFSFSVQDSSRRLLLQTEASESLKIAASEFSPADLSTAQILPQNQTVGEQNDLVFRLMLASSLNAERSVQINISIPNNFQLLDQCTFTGLSEGLVNTKSCKVDVGGRMVQIAGFAAKTLSGSTSVIFKVSGAVVNPTSRPKPGESIGDFTIKTMMDGQPVDYARISKAFSIVAGSLYAASMEFIPSLNAYSNPWM